MDAPWVAAQRRISALREAFSALERPRTAQLRGRYAAELIGPGWLRRLAPPTLAATGLAHWWGKDFDGNGTASNLVRSDNGHLDTRLETRLVWARSPIDGHPGLLLRYAPDAPLPWRYVVDEVRLLDDGALLGMTMVDVPALRRLPMPFLLRHP